MKRAEAGENRGWREQRLKRTEEGENRPREERKDREKRNNDVHTPKKN